MSVLGSRNGFMRSELGLRILSAILLLIVILSTSWLGGWVFSLICAALSAVMYYEWQRIVALTPFDLPEATLLAGFIFLVGMSLIGYPFSGFIVLIAIGVVLEMTTHGDERRQVLWTGLGAVYCAIPVLALPLIREVSGFELLLLLFLVVWVTDIAAYFAGRGLGGPKLFPAISPKKTWSGAIGGLIGAVAIAGFYAFFFTEWNVTATIVLGIFLSVFSQAGDLFESWVKRCFGFKDSSALIPGHGGFLDRVDGLVAAAIPVAVIVMLSIR